MSINISDTFKLDSFNVYSDSENYYFFRALNGRDMKCIQDGSILDESGKIVRIITDREFFGPTSGYTEESNISLEEVVDHVKMHYDHHTNCISLTSNANTALTYGRQNYEDKYVMIKVPKGEINKSVYFAGSYMLEEINKRINELIKNHDLEDYDMQKYFIDAIDSCTTQEQLDRVKLMLPQKDKINDNDIYEGGLEFSVTNSQNYQVLSDKQNLEKNKVILKLDVLNKNLLPRYSNSFLSAVVGLGFSSLELTHYKDIPEERIIELPSELVDVFGLIQQIPDNLDNISELKQSLLNSFLSYRNNKVFEYKSFSISDELTIDYMYEITQGRVDYKTAMTLYSKAFSLAKSKLRNKNSTRILKEIIDNKKFDFIFAYLDKYGYGIEPEITTRLSKNLLNISESVSIDINSSEKLLADFINTLNDIELTNILTKPDVTLHMLLNRFVKDNYLYKGSKEDWFANSIIDNIGFKSLGVNENLSNLQRRDIIQALKENDFLNIYYELKKQGIKEKDIARVLITNLIKNKNTVDLNDNFTLEELEWFIGYNRVKGLGLNLRNYQRTAVRNIKEKFKSKQFTSVILPTGAGKSYVALEQLFEHRNEKLLYVAPNVEILNQLKSIIRKIYAPEEHIGEDIDTIVSRLFPNLTLTTYQNLKDKKNNTLKEEFKNIYNYIVFDELHRTGATEWMNQVKELLDRQDKNTKILGITATPERDVDLKNMADFWAERYGYTEEEILSCKHLAYNLDLIEAINLGILANPKVINCAYSLVTDGSMDSLKKSIEDLSDEDLKKSKMRDFESLRRNIENSNGIEKILHDNIKDGRKYIIFLPVTQRDDGVYEDEDGNVVEKSKAENIIEKYQALMRQYLFSYEYLNNPSNRVRELYLKILNNIQLSDEDKEYFIVEKRNILLLSKIDIPGKSNILNTETNLIADTIINYMGWQNMDYKSQLHWLKNLTSEKVEDYSMLGYYSEKKNKKQLDYFNDKCDCKTKFMFVMNKLNEGIHVEDISGIVWLRPLDTNSRILYLQQLGRCLKSLIPGKIITEDEKPLIIDLVNNTLNVNLDKGISSFEKDSALLQYIVDWIINNGRFPSSAYDEELKYLSFLNKIQIKYTKYLDDSFLNKLDLKNKLIIREIINLGSTIDLWNIKLDNDLTNSKFNSFFAKDANILISGIIDPVSRNFIELKEDVERSIYCKSPINWVNRIQEYCKTYSEWPKSNGDDAVKTIKDGTPSRYLYNWLLRSGYVSGEFQYSDVCNKDGRPIKEILDELYKKYAIANRYSDENKVLWVKRIIEYCETYDDWPRRNSEHKDNCISDGTKSSNLCYWLTDSGYGTSEFKFSDIVDETGRPIKEILDELYKEYAIPNSRFMKPIFLNVSRIKEYCETYKKWPEYDDEPTNIVSDGTTPAKLYSWLLRSGYISNNFKYNDVKDKNGLSIKEILDELFKKYGHINAHSDASKVLWVERIREFCKTYGVWPQRSKEYNDKSISDGTKSSNLCYWLTDSGYGTSEFRFNDIVDETGRPIKEILDELYKEYGSVNRYSDANRVLWVKRIQEYCKTYNEWPKVDKEHRNNSISDGTTSAKLYDWIARSGYYSKEFKFDDIVDETGRPIKEILDELYKKYHQLTNKSDASKILWVKRIQEYCELYGWPKSGKKSKENRIKDGTSSEQICAWLKYSGYNSGSFMYGEIIDESGNKLIDILNNLRNSYKLNAKKGYAKSKAEFDESSKFGEAVRKVGNDERKVL